ncbi:MAG: two-component sensor histidine kinase, partial [Chloroflexi bacterium]
ADPSRITQVLLNLMGNALQYTPPGGRVTIRAWSTGEAVTVAVQDTGIGIPAQHLPHIFERFYRVDKSRSRAGGGSGIGLTIAKHLVEAHGGRIWAESAGPNQGSTFTFTLPRA